MTDTKRGRATSSSPTSRSSRLSGASREVGDDEARARLAWTLVTEPGRERPGLTPPAHVALIAEVGHVEAWHRLVEGGLPRAEAAMGRLESLDLDGYLRALADTGAILVMPGDPLWPPGLADGPAGFAPHLLHARGAWVADDAPWPSMVAMVGSRASTGYGESVAGHLSAALAEHEWAVVSGAAFGIDAAAHRGALAAGAGTVVVLPCGIDLAYPGAHARLIDHVAASGMVLSELPLGEVARRHRFLARNRLIAGLGLATCVVEAGRRSGSLNTAAWAESLGRPVGAVPGPITSMSSAGCHEWLRTHRAEIVTDVDELLELASPLGASPVEVPAERLGPGRPLDALSPAERRVVESLPLRGVADIATVAGDARLSVDDVLDHLALLELNGWAVRGEGGWRRSAP